MVSCGEDCRFDVWGTALCTDGMFNIILIAHLLSYITRIIQGGDVSEYHNATSSEISPHAHGIMTTNLFCEYPKDAFQILINRQCPATHSFCVIDVPFDVLLNQRYRCATAPRRTALVVHLMNSSQLLAQVNSDSELYGGHSNCMLTAFYSPDCAFSIRMVSYLYRLPRMYSRLRVVATDARDHSKLNSRYGIIGTPTILLWVDGSVVSRMDEAPFSLKAFRNYIEKWTDLEVEYIPTMGNENDLIENIR
uniref:Thioredoxin domain-containing protein n=1 Tax=Elaeophora elaphi TaxID=1147741 RepID=A0A0R3S0Y4_9BILA